MGGIGLVPTGSGAPNDGSNIAAEKPDSVVLD